MPPPMIAGLYFYCRGGERRFPRFTMAEIPQSLVVNPSYREGLVVYAGDRESADLLESHHVRVHRVLDDAPASVHRDAAHKMKHWMCLQALEEFGEFLWVDWDTVLLREPDDLFWSWCRSSETPKFLRIPSYWATVNCGVYYCPSSWRERLIQSFEASVSEPNDELLWRSVLPPDVVSRPEFWWNGRVEHIWTDADVNLVGPGHYFAHVKDFSWTERLKGRAGAHDRVVLQT
jgi:hypothetical protein